MSLVNSGNSGLATSLYSALKRVGRVFSITDLVQMVSTGSTNRGQIQQMLDLLVSHGVVRKGKKGNYTKLNIPALLRGHVRVRKNGRRVFVSTVAGPSPDEFQISPPQLYQAMDGDQVLALEIEGDTRRGEARRSGGRRLNVLILEITERKQQTITGLCRYNSADDTCLVYAEPSDMPFLLTEEGQEENMSQLDGMVARLGITIYPIGGKPGRAIVLEVLGQAGDPHVDILAAASKVGIPLHFSPEAKQAAISIPTEVQDDVCATRADLCHLPFVTIDGEDAKDFDDAIAFEPGRDSGNVLWVAIADVSHYVQPNSALDLDAYERGNSTYFPGFSLPMLPRELSNGICSLMPGVKRLAVVLEIHCTDAGVVSEMVVHLAVIRSRARLTYTQVQKSLDGAADVDEGITPQIQNMLRPLFDFSRQLNKNRTTRGALDFDLPEAQIDLDDSGHVVGVTRRDRLDAHRIVEECMLLANESVADYLQKFKVQGIYRLHDKPELSSINQFQEFLSAFNIGINLDSDGIKPWQLRQVLHQIDDPAQAFIINRVLLHSMKQAYYAAHPGEHFALATSSYGHFTSPIRRYSDLIQHRMLKLCVDANIAPGSTDSVRTHEPGPASLEIMADHATSCERRSMEAERNIVALRSCQFMQDKLEEIFPGFITGVTEFGFFVELDPFFVEGLVHVRTLADDYYVYDPVQRMLLGQRRRRHFKIGQKVDVMVQDVRLKTREIDFVLPESLQAVEKTVLRRKRKAPRAKRA
ncbi:MAG: ribonuclease R [Desulfuromonadaceae bacterium]|nr:ribonuclease R [Desulfuromonas sp.]MDY0184743.1 ribonuclease R [Desulfuromonadaceae bacterium]